MNLYRLDNPVAGAQFERDLEQIRQRILDAKIPPQNGFTLIPQSGDVQPWAETYTHRMAEFVGLAQFISDYADDLPMVDVTGREDTYKVKVFGCAYQFSRKEQMQAGMGLGLSDKRPLAARRAIEQKFNRIMFYGDPAVGIFGWLNFPYIPRFAVSLPFGGASTPLNVLAEMNAIFDAPDELTDTVANPDTFLLAPAEYNYVNTTPLGSGSDTTILEHFLGNRAGVTVEKVRELTGAGPGGGNVGIVYRRSQDNLEHKLVEPFTQLAPQPRNLAVVTNCVAQTGGVVSDYPLEMVIAEFPV